MASKSGAKKGATKKGMTKTEFLSALASHTELSKKQLESVFDSIAEILKSEFRARRVVTLPGLAKFTVRDVPAKPARQVRNPATGQMMMAKPKPASKKVRITAIKALKDLA